ncbi:MAG: hypothetical protein OEV44_15085 [Spirochaetota bacterium]|nr:hypothetical protein [Spirochaetota bacterium]
MDQMNYIYYNGVLQNLQKQLIKPNADKDALNRAIKSIENRIKEFESKPTEYQRGKFLHNSFQNHLSRSKDKLSA